MRWLVKTLFRLLLLGAVIFVIWAFFADLPAPVETRTIALPPPGAAAPQSE